MLADDKLLSNTRAIQLQNDIEAADAEAPLEAWDLFDVPADAPTDHFRVGLGRLGLEPGLEAFERFLRQR